MKDHQYNIPNVNRAAANVYLTKAGLTFFIVYRYARNHFGKHFAKLCVYSPKSLETRISNCERILADSADTQAILDYAKYMADDKKLKTSKIQMSARKIRTLI